MLRAGMVQLVKKQRNYHIDRDSMIDLIFTNITGKVSAVIDTRPSGYDKKIKIQKKKRLWRNYTEEGKPTYMRQ